MSVQQKVLEFTVLEGTLIGGEKVSTLSTYIRRVTFEKSCLLFTENHGKPPQKCTGSDAEQIILKISCKKFLKHFEVYVVKGAFMVKSPLGIF